MILSTEEALIALPDILREMKTDMVVCKSSSFFLSAPMILPRIALGKWKLTDDNTLITDEGIIVLPCATPQHYFSKLTSKLVPGATILRVPEYIGAHLKKAKSNLKVSVATTEYIQTPETLSTLPGKRLRNMRSYVRRAAISCETNTNVILDSKILADFHNLNDAWYRDANKRMFRTYEKKNIDWLLDNWSEAQQIDATMRLAETRCKETGELEVFHIAGQLCNGVSTGYCERYRRNGIVSANYNGFGQLALALGEPLINDGTADSAAIRALKEKLSDHTIKTYNVEVPRR